MKIAFIASLLCLFFNLSSLAQPEASLDDAKVSIEEITLARGDGSGEAGEATDIFLTTDVPIYCVIQLNSLKSTTVKMILVAVKVNGLKPETKSISVSYTTNGKQNRVNFNASPDGVWAAGDYRADIYIDGKFAQSKAFKIEKSDTVPAEKPIAPKAFTPRKIVKKTRKN